MPLENDSYSTDDENWFDLEKKSMRAMAREDVRKICNKMMVGKDKRRIANYLGISTETLRRKVYRGTVKADEMLVISYLCGYKIEPEDVSQMVIEEVVCD